MEARQQEEDDDGRVGSPTAQLTSPKPSPGAVDAKVAHLLLLFRWSKREAERWRGEKER